LILSHLLLYLLAAWRGCHERWNDVFAHDGPAPLLLLLEPLPVDGGPLCGCCHGAQRLGHAHDQPPLNRLFIECFCGFDMIFQFDFVPKVLLLSIWFGPIDVILRFESIM
jgi:hypothetical protein